MARAPIATLARKTADQRRVLVNLFAGPKGQSTALALMSVARPTPEHLAMATILANTYRDSLAHAQLFLADTDMVDLLDTAAPTMPDQELHYQDVITPHGFVYFADPLPDRSGEPPPIPVHAMSWTLLADTHPVLADHETGTEALAITAYVRTVDLFAAYPDTASATLIPGAPGLTPNATVVWTFGSLIGHTYGQVPPHDHPHTPGFYQRLLATFWTLTQQPKVADTEHVPPGQPADHRRSRRAGVLNPTAPVHVVRLHHTAPSGGPQVRGTTATGRKVGVRFAVRGHWRQQWYSTIQSHRHIWIDPHLRGPEDAPLVGGERVFLAKGPGVSRPEPPKA